MSIQIEVKEEQLSKQKGRSNKFVGGCGRAVHFKMPNVVIFKRNSWLFDTKRSKFVIVIMSTSGDFENHQNFNLLEVENDETHQMMIIMAPNVEWF